MHSCNCCSKKKNCCCSSSEQNNGFTLTATSRGLSTVRDYDGSGNNLFTPIWGKANELLLRKSPASYDPGTQLAVRGSKNPNPRVISNQICMGVSQTNTLGRTDMVWAWGQFIDHTFTLVPSQSGPGCEKLPITTPPDDAYPGFTIPFTRSQFTLVDGIRNFSSQLPSFINGSNVYGTDVNRVYKLRRLDGTGRMLTSVAANNEKLLPLNTFGLDNENATGLPANQLFAAGDVRVNEVVPLIAMHTLFVREHNRVCEELIANNPPLQGRDEVLFQTARRVVIGIMQRITYREFLPALLGDFMANKLNDQKYDTTVDPRVVLVFSTALFRFGHSMISSTIQVGASGTLQLRDLFFNPNYVQVNGVNSILFGLTQHLMQKVDNVIVEDLRSFLFSPPMSNMLHDLASLNIQRGRDHGLPDYNTVRAAYGLTTFSMFSELPIPVAIQNSLENLYCDINAIDPWIGAICENNLPGAVVGELIANALVEQFTRLSKGDRFYFKSDIALSSVERGLINNTKLSDLLKRNTTGFDFSGNAFVIA